MIRRSIPFRIGSALMSLAFAATFVAPAFADQTVTLPKGTPIHLIFDSYLNSDTAKPGQRVTFHTEMPVAVDGKTLIPEGTKVYATVTKVNKQSHFGVNAKIQLIMSPIRAVNGEKVPIGFKTKAQTVSSRTGEAAGASVGSAIVLGPVGLVAGFFIPGKKVSQKPGDKMTVTTDEDIEFHFK
ncbi:MAG TPA: hypothetical protein VFA07_06525 [Chthonomonadaceae bacterium]|nr:hypothetical protein [Chthonomonadaceae bacterium]